VSTIRPNGLAAACAVGQELTAVFSSVRGHAQNGTAHERTAAPTPLLRISLFGGFRAERSGVVLPDPAWRRRSAKGLTKLLATSPRHALHREQVLEILWPDTGTRSALNNLTKALHAARRALEPDLSPRATSAYLKLLDEMVVLDVPSVLVDSDEFEDLAYRALEEETVCAYNAALAAYGGDLLPEDAGVPWADARRTALRDLHLRLLVGRADTLDSDARPRPCEGRSRAIPPGRTSIGG
jgi:DNA-binding SARP family transcriptional activator